MADKILGNSNRLRNQLFRRAGLGPVSPNGLPSKLPSRKPRLKPEWRRFLTSMRMQQAYANNWNPNPILIRLLDGEK